MRLKNHFLLTLELIIKGNHGTARTFSYLLGFIPYAFQKNDYKY